MIPGETGESTQVIPFVDELAVLYKHTTLFDVFSLDAGLSPQDNYTGIIESGYRCIARMKGNRGKIYDQIKDRFSDNEDPKHVTTETHNGKTVKRELWTSCETSELSWKDIAQAWYIRQTTTDHRAGTSDTIVEIEISRTSSINKGVCIQLLISGGILPLCSTVFPKAPLQSRTVGFPESGFDPNINSRPS